MPNWVKHCVEVHGSTEELSKFKQETFSTDKAGDAVFDFNKIIPMPESLNMEVGSVSSTADILFHGIAGDYFNPRVTEISKETTIEQLRANMLISLRYVDGLKGIDGKFTPQSTAYEVQEYVKANAPQFYEMAMTRCSNRVNYGHADWYDWRVANWGTKWGANDTYIRSEPKPDDQRISKDHMEFTFDTAWGHPEQVFAAVVAKYPQLEFTVWFFDEAPNFCGTGMGEGGEYCTESISTPGRTPVNMAIYEKVYGEEWELYEEESEEESDDSQYPGDGADVSGEAAGGAAGEAGEASSQS